MAAVCGCLFYLRLAYWLAGLLRNEFPNLFRSLFNNYQKHEVVIHALTLKAKGLTRDEIINSTGFGADMRLNRFAEI